MGSSQQLLLQEKAPYAPVEAPCPYFGTCGGCSLQDISYADQLTLKAQRIQRAFGSLGLVPSIPVIPVDEPWRYRNKAELTFGCSEGRMTLGYHAARSFWRLVDLEDCLLLPEPSAQVIQEVRTLAEQTGLPAYNPKTHQGFFRYLIIRHSRCRKEVLLCLITTSGNRSIVEKIVDRLMERIPAIASVYWGVSQKLADVAVPEELIHLRGSKYLEDELGPFRLQIHPLSFLQPNGAQAHRLYEQIDRLLPETSRRVAWDLYCGIGLVGFYLSKSFQTVYGIDVEPHHLEMARINATRNGLNNIDFRVGRTESLLMDRRFWLQEAKPDVIALDPPRAGLHPQTLNGILAARPAAIVYLSCNVQSLVRDLQGLLCGFPRYRLSDVMAFDMFPQTPHMELLTVLAR